MNKAIATTIMSLFVVTAFAAEPAKKDAPKADAKKEAPAKADAKKEAAKK